MSVHRLPVEYRFFSAPEPRFRSVAAIVPFGISRPEFWAWGFALVLGRRPRIVAILFKASGHWPSVDVEWAKYAA